VKFYSLNLLETSVGGRNTFLLQF